MGMTFVPNPLFARQVASEIPMALFLEEEANEVKAAAEAVSPVATGRYKKSFSAGVEKTAEGFKGIVSNSAPYALFVEFGTEDTPTFQPLRRGLDTVTHRSK